MKIDVKACVVGGCPVVYINDYRVIGGNPTGFEQKHGANIIFDTTKHVVEEVVYTNVNTPAFIAVPKYAKVFNNILKSSKKNAKRKTSTK